MKKSLKIITIIAIVLALLIPYTISYGADEKSFFEVASEEITTSDIIEATINIEEVSYDNFIFELVSDFDISGIEVSQDEEIENVEAYENTEIIVEDNNVITIQIDKSTTLLNTIILNCDLPSDIEVGDTISFTATVTNIDNQEESESIQITISIVETSSNISAESIESEYDEENLTEVGTNETELISYSEDGEMILSSDFSNSASSASMTESSMDSSSLESSSVTSDSLESGETISYNGSDNCYLSELAVDSYELNKTFSKESTTYFVTVNDDVDSLDITASAEDDEATICIYGNDNINTGENKILITVTAENGNIRTYRIYVTKN